MKDEDYEEDDESVIDQNFEVDKTTGTKKRVAKKVTIEIYSKDPNDGHECKFSEGAGENGELSNKPYTHVGFGASYYGAGHPCSTDEEIESSIEHCKAWIIREGDIPLVKDYRQLKTLEAWFG